MSRAWQTQQERGTPGALKLIRWIALHLGRGPARLLLYPITGFFLFIAAPQRRASYAYLRRTLPHQPSIIDVARHIHCFAATILDRVFLLQGKLDAFDVTMHGSEQVLSRLEQQQGCILLGSHLGSFEVLRVLSLSLPNLPLKILMYQNHNQAVTRLLEALNPKVAEMVIDLGAPNALLKVHESVMQGDFIGMLGDRVADSDKTCECDFLGSPAVFPTGPMLLAGMLKVPVILFFGLYRGGNRYDVYFELLTEQVTWERSQRQTDLTTWTQRYVARLEHYTRNAPYNWFNFYDYWDEIDT